MAYLLAGLILFSAAAKSVAPPSWLVLSTLRRTDLARFGLTAAELAVVAGLLSQRWAAAVTAAVFAIVKFWRRPRGNSPGSRDCGCFGARQPTASQRSWRDRIRGAVVLGAILGTIASAVLPGADPHSVMVRIGLVVVGGALGQLLWPLQHLSFSTEWLRQNTAPQLASVVVWAMPLNMRFHLRGVTVRMLAVTDPPWADITIHWIPTIRALPSWQVASGMEGTHEDIYEGPDRHDRR